MAITTSINDTTDNTTISSTSSSTSTTGTSSAEDLSSSFLTLLVAQLKNQDPTNPMDNSELTSQLAQISTVSGIEKLNTTLGSISGQISSGTSVQASSLIGHGVMVSGSAILVGSDTDGTVSTTPFGFELETASDTTTATVSDSTGKVVKTITLGSQTAGVHSYTWDGTQDDGTKAPDGSYTFSINALNNGQQMVATPLNYALVNGVTTDSSGNTALDLGVRGTATVDSVRQIL
ncbi:MULTISPECIES: flagellar hook assembly protein FlgD [Rahnella]|jgi:flagellar basal-body rod modification protein FlgD|uniref:Basal-body rod modification protein FlgD n=1 Tax=Rahnella victoriana TaxID=1510570 RepID=A0ABS0DQ32_9GAMM|nr:MULTISPECIES: flagellar hook assembly protein FlgD [Rahnella]VTQ52795.1 flagellar basal body rod modification protein [Campylobacter jejuni]MBF7955991.1 flagellar hook assembly protein FlgD [Rahnella victoriana]TBX31699.1 flagellar hook assembly protein FlgD [Rahnella victoriana]TDS84342.1 flagellar basal-body rod modification protein FlgD [Rahnella sp. BIGb0236]UHM89986.1 flagellar hook assembly protein FlgD [Rahnella victoriana]